MKKRIVIVIAFLVIVSAICFIWYTSTIDLLDLDPDEIIEISIFNGNTGNFTHITDKTEITYIINNLNNVTIKRSKPSVGYSGFSFQLTIYLSDGNEADGWNNFIINSDSTIRKDPFFYDVVDGNIDYDYIQSITK